MENSSKTLIKTKLQDTTNMAMGFPISNLRIEQTSTPRPTPWLSSQKQSLAQGNVELLTPVCCSQKEKS